MHTAIRITLTAMALLLTAGVHAQVYVAVDIGRATVKSDVADGKANASSLAFGYRFDKHYAIEAAFRDFGSGGGSIPAAGTMAPLDAGSGFGLSVIGNLPASESFSLLGKIGAQHLAKGSIAADDLGWTSVVGGGVQWKVDKHLAFRVFTERVNGKQNLISLRALTTGMLISF